MSTTLQDLASQQGWDVSWDQSTNLVSLYNPTNEQYLSFASGSGNYGLLPGLTNDRNMVGDPNILMNLMNQQGIPSVPKFEFTPYQSSYDDLLKNMISNLGNKQFSYDPNQDQSYQAFVQQQQRLGQLAFDNTLGGLSAATGGRPSSWAGAVAADTQQAYAMRASEAMGQFEQMAYGRFMDSYNMDLKQVGLIMDMDDREFKKFAYNEDRKWQMFQHDYQQRLDAIQERRNKYNEALDRTEITGYVSNRDAAILGLAPGTPSKDARLHTREIQDYLFKLEKEMEMYKQKAMFEFGLEKQMINYRNSLSGSKSGSGGSGGSSTTTVKPPTAGQTSYYTKLRTAMNTSFSGYSWDALTDEQKKSKFLQTLKQWENDAALHPELYRNLENEMSQHPDFGRLFRSSFIDPEFIDGMPDWWKRQSGYYDAKNYSSVTDYDRY
jgi:hypothetical protein